MVGDLPEREQIEEVDDMMTGEGFLDVAVRMVLSTAGIEKKEQEGNEKEKEHMTVLVL